MSNEKKEESNIYERLWKLYIMIGKMIMDGVRDPHKVADLLQTIVDEVAEAKVYLKRLFESEIITVAATDGTETLRGSGLFPGGVYGVTLPVPERPVLTVLTNAIIHELVEDGKFAEFFGSLGESQPRWKGESQVVAFVRGHKDKLRDGGCATFFELEGGFVAVVRFDDNGLLRVYVYVFSLGIVWDAEYEDRVVSPQQ